MDTTDDGLTDQDWFPFIAVIGEPLQPIDHRIVMEKTVVLKDIDLSLRRCSGNVHGTDICAELEI